MEISPVPAAGDAAPNDAEESLDPTDPRPPGAVQMVDPTVVCPPVPPVAPVFAPAVPPPPIVTALDAPIVAAFTNIFEYVPPLPPPIPVPVPAAAPPLPPPPPWHSISAYFMLVVGVYVPVVVITTLLIVSGPPPLVTRLMIPVDESIERGDTALVTIVPLVVGMVIVGVPALACGENIAFPDDDP